MRHRQSWIDNKLDVVFVWNIRLWLIVYTIKRLTNYTILVGHELG
jgi:hypothetical protein